MSTEQFNHQFISRISEVAQCDWQRLAGRSLFTSYAWLGALESSGSVSKQTGWQPYHLVIYQQGNSQPFAILPGYIKSHSYGEYVFDWAWAEAYERHQLEYYPKWLCGVPFTPVVGTRLLCKTPTESLYQYIQSALNEATVQHDWSGWHVNFPSAAEDWSNTRLLERHGVQFHWHNQQYADFDAFLATMKARKRKMIKKERDKITQSQLTIVWLDKSSINKEIIDLFYQCYCHTYRKRSGHNGYLTRAFFDLLFTAIPEQIKLCCAYRKDTQADIRNFVAASLYLQDEDTLYGRYWGALEHSEHLHFELCYYQGIDYAISHKLARFDAGAQGEHKLLRGFEPVLTHSYHTICHPLFNQAIDNFINTERSQIAHYALQCKALLPYKTQ
ncbi:GNAT family N-acetyltransferase [Pseudoalteromonas luteoviolacea]|uniref:GNAT family N-acetyltransferase n=1 Tax=Pseudoalteromonas luteoviolacea TaxID=43657 RepID=UPI001B3656BB|nr:GNAT family N-acetyltransferase [Pseudoalteromonas luteoviolacea]MBQ4838972.1 N-acetyltransferase [Pseudoalteromonas luteoviolacea]